MNTFQTPSRVLCRKAEPFCKAISHQPSAVSKSQKAGSCFRGRLSAIDENAVAAATPYLPLPPNVLVVAGACQSFLPSGLSPNWHARAANIALFSPRRPRRSV